MQLYFNGQFHTFSNPPKVDWILCGAGKILALGTKENRPEQLPGLECKTDLQGKTIIPAFTDAHTHFVATALQKKQIDLSQSNSLSAALKKIAHFSNSYSANEWIRGGGYNRNMWQDGQPHKKLLDEIFPDNPVALESKDFHSFWLNSRALEIAGIDEKSPDPDGGKIYRDSDGKLTGIVSELAMNRIYEKITLPPNEKVIPAVKDIGKEFLKNGITTVHTMEGLAEFKIVQKMANENSLDLRVHFYVPAGQAKSLVDAGIQSVFGSEFLSIAGVKFFTDGSLGSQTALMQEPYENSKYYGISHISVETLKKEILFYNQNHLNVAVHAIGDQALLNTLQALKFSNESLPELKLNNRIEHTQLIPKDWLPDIKKLNVHLSMQPAHISFDVEIAEKYWGSRCKQAYPLKDILEADIPLTMGSDTPVTDFNPFTGIYAAVERKYLNNPENESWQPQQAINLQQALSAYTVGAANLLGLPAITGTLSIGSLADFIVLDRDVFSESMESVKDTQVIETIMNGKVVYYKE